jgi:hypothetical protein
MGQPYYPVKELTFLIPSKLNCASRSWPHLKECTVNLQFLLPFLLKSSLNLYSLFFLLNFYLIIFYANPLYMFALISVVSYFSSSCISFILVHPMYFLDNIILEHIRKRCASLCFSSLSVVHPIRVTINFSLTIMQH